jgi:hypothetical protein
MSEGKKSLLFFSPHDGGMWVGVLEEDNRYAYGYKVNVAGQDFRIQDISLICYL